MGNIGENFCQGCNEIFGDGKSYGENNLAKEKNMPITNIKNPFFFNNKTNLTILEPQTNNESFLNNNNNKTDTYITTLNNPLPAEEEQKIIYRNKNENNKNNLFNTNNNPTIKVLNNTIK